MRGKRYRGQGADCYKLFTLFTTIHNCRRRSLPTFPIQFRVTGFSKFSMASRLANCLDRIS